MNKLHTVIAAFIAATTMATAGDFDLFEQVQADFKTNMAVNEATYNLTGEQWLEYMRQVCATNAILFQQTGKYTAKFTIHPTMYVLLDTYARKNIPTEEGRHAFYAQWDTNVVNSGMYFPHHAWYHRFPLARQKFFENDTIWMATYPVNYQLWQRYPDIPEESRPVAAQVNAWLARYAKGLEFQKTIPSNIKTLSNKATGVVKRWLRTQGKTFVVGPDGKNPVQEEIDKLVTALQAPLCDGAKEWFEVHCPDYVWIDYEAPTYDSTTNLQDAVFFGDKPLDTKNAVLLQYGLGVDGYNTFIEEYNSDATVEP